MLRPHPSTGPPQQQSICLSAETLPSRCSCIQNFSTTASPCRSTLFATRPSSGIQRRCSASSSLCIYSCRPDTSLCRSVGPRFSTRSSSTLKYSYQTILECRTSCSLPSFFWRSLSLLTSSLSSHLSLSSTTATPTTVAPGNASSNVALPRRCVSMTTITRCIWKHVVTVTRSTS